MITVSLYIAVVIIWGSAWLAVKYQIGIVPPEISVAYRIGIAAVFMFGWCLVRGLPLRFKLREHLLMLLQGALIFSTNFFLFYLAAAHLTTGLIAVICSTASAMTMLINSLILLQLPPLRFLLGALLGVAGISLIFINEWTGFSLQSAVGVGILLSLGGTFCFSVGSIVSSRNRAAGFSVCGNTAWAMFYGTGVLCLYALVRGKHFQFDFSVPYTVSLAYLSLVGSVIAFAAYFALLGRIKAEQAAYVTVLFPLVALTLSTFFEGYQWTVSAVLGVFVTLFGNVLILSKSLK